MRNALEHLVQHWWSADDPRFAASFSATIHTSDDAEYRKRQRSQVRSNRPSAGTRLTPS